MITVAQVESFPFPAVDFKFVNRGDCAAIVHEFGVELLEAELDETPIVRFHGHAKGRKKERDELPGLPRFDHQGDLTVMAANAGWGPALNCNFVFRRSLLDHLYSKEALRFDGDVSSGAVETILTLGSRNMRKKRFKTLLKERTTICDAVRDALKSHDESIRDEKRLRELLSKHEHWHLQDFFHDINHTTRSDWHIEYLVNHFQSFSHALPINGIEVAGSCFGKDGSRYLVNEVVRTNWLPDASAQLWITTQTSIYETFSPPMYHQMPSYHAYVSFVELDLGETPFEKTYPISHQIPAGEAERFHIILGSTQSARIVVRFKFYIDKDQVVESDRLTINVWRPINARVSSAISDGAHFVQEDGIWYLCKEDEGRWRRESLEELSRHRRRVDGIFPF